MDQEKKENSTFRGAEPTWANACVGENGQPSYWEYAKGFSQAATILIDLALSHRGLKHPVDELVYPVCFNMRHSIELRLKGAIAELAVIENYRSRRIDFDSTGTHDIQKIWSFFTEKAREADNRYESIIQRLDKTICDFAEIDASGQTFRYPLNKESQKHLVEVSLINFLVLKKSFTEIEVVLDELYQLSKYLCDEYSWGTYTNKLSRRDLFELVSLLPSRSLWGNPRFREKKEELKNRFQISSNEFSKAIKLIESNYEMASEIEVSIPLCGVNEVDISEFFGLWAKQRESELLQDRKGSRTVSSSAVEWFESIKKDLILFDEVWNLIQGKISPEKLAGLQALYYFARELKFSERYEQIYNEALEEFRLKFLSGANSLRKDFFHLYEKTNALDNILKSLYFLGRAEIADRFVMQYGLESEYPWLRDARTGVLYQKPKYCGYSE